MFNLFRVPMSSAPTYTEQDQEWLGRGYTWGSKNQPHLWEGNLESANNVINSMQEADLFGEFYYDVERIY